MFLVIQCSPRLPSMILDKTCGCISISSKAEALFWRAEVMVFMSVSIQTSNLANIWLHFNLIFFVQIMQRLFFLNGEQDLSAFLLVDLGIVKYPTYNCIITEQIFSNRDDLLAYEKVLLCLCIICYQLLLPLWYVLFINIAGYWSCTNHWWGPWWK